MHRSLPLPIGLSLLLSACLGGGGGSGGGGGGVSLPLDRTPVAFTAFGDIGPNTLVEFSSPEIDDGGGGIEPMTVNARTVYDPGAGTVTSIDAVTNGPVSALVYVDGSGDAAQARLTVTFPADPDLVTDFTDAAVAGGDQDDFLVFTNEVGAGDVADMLAVYVPDDPLRELEYMTFGAWALGLDTVQADLGAAIWGAATPTADMPPILAATYNGGLLGTWIDLAGEVGHYEADSTLTADFLLGQVGISSINTRHVDTGAAQAGLDIFNAGDAIIAGNAFTGGSFTVGADGLSFGEFNGVFYGPNAEEAGATFAVDFDFGTYFGSLGGKR